MQFNNYFEVADYLNFILKRINEHDLNLKGKTIFTELANGAYQFNGLVPIISNAKKTYLKAVDNSYGKREDVVSLFAENFSKLGLQGNYEFIETHNEKEALAQADIITNSANIRPFNVEKLKFIAKNAVIPLMWETWEFNPEELDLEYCKQKSILVMGTYETRKPLDMRGYNGLLILKLLFTLGFSGESVLVVGGPDVFSFPMVKVLRQSGIEVLYVGNTQKSDISWSNFLKNKKTICKNFNYIVFANHSFDCGVEDQRTFFQELKNINPLIKVGNISSTFQADPIEESGLRFFPPIFRGKGLMSYNLYELGPIPVLDLFIAGLKVGQEMSNGMARYNDTRLAAKHALSHSPAMDFTGNDSWL